MIIKNFQCLKINKQGFTQHHFWRAKSGAGFTMIEMIISLGIFSVVVVTFTSSFLSLITAERKITASVSVQDNLRFALEVMAKEIRTGTAYVYSEELFEFSFINAVGEGIKYRRNPADKRIEKEIAGSFLPLTSDQISVDHLGFEVVGNDPTDDFQPMVTITVGASSKTQGIGAELNLQTTISQRKPDS